MEMDIVQVFKKSSEIVADNQISDLEKSYILNVLGSWGIDLNHNIEEIDWVWKNSRGKFTTRLAKWIPRYARLCYCYGEPITESAIHYILDYVGKFQTRCRFFTDFVSGPFNWGASGFGGYINSCWWDSHNCQISAACMDPRPTYDRDCSLSGQVPKDVFAELGGYCLRYYSDKSYNPSKGVGRTWVWPLKAFPSCGVLFNTYYKGSAGDNNTFIEKVAICFNLQFTKVSKLTVDFYSNSGTIFLLGPKNIDLSPIAKRLTIEPLLSV
jgi:hypothetical protein